MSTDVLSDIYRHSAVDKVSRKNTFRVWYDLFIYAKNLNGNWMTSQELFNKRIAPQAMEDPHYFASCVEKMVETSGMQVKYPSNFRRALSLLRSIRNNTINSNQVVVKAITEMLNAGLSEPLYAERAMRIATLAQTA